ncbi:hypothetical protein [Sphingomicrobium nitratireducens]|uniref:hypothetical protein n=1 Tax=Sphingomicrobium nitratireducens TaxID=2964666 RepID=UPI0022408B8B|nr:hypothetical protein [Sphingomicrobium nitratireducens]
MPSRALFPAAAASLGMALMPFSMLGTGPAMAHRAMPVRGHHGPMHKGHQPEQGDDGPMTGCHACCLRKKNVVEEGDDSAAP